MFQIKKQGLSEHLLLAFSEMLEQGLF